MVVAVTLVAAACGGGATAGDAALAEVPVPEVPEPPPPEDPTPPAAPAEEPAAPAPEPSPPATEPDAQPEPSGQSAGPDDGEPGAPAGPEPPAEPAVAPGTGGQTGDGAEGSDEPPEADAATTDGEPGETGTDVEPTGADTEPAPSDPTGAEADGAVDVRGTVEFAGCGLAYLCATLAVPADHDDPGGRTVELALGMLPAGDPSRRVGYLLANPGGPGGGMQGFLDLGAGLSPYLLEHFDVVGWDPRGVGGSISARCWVDAIELHLVDPLPDSPTERAALDGAARALAEACLAGLGDMVGHIGTVDTVRDMDAIRRALGAETISYIGFSYGTLLGALYAGMFGEHLRAAVLDGVVDPSLPSLEQAVGQMVGFDRAVEAMFAWCRTESVCAVTGDPAATYYGLLEQVDESPLLDSNGRVVLGPGRVVLAAVFATYSSTLWPFFFEFLAEAAAGDGTMLGRVGEAYTALADLGAFISIGCTDSGAATRAELDAMTEALNEVAGVLGRASAVSALPCEYWPVATGTRPVGPVAAPQAPPILVVGNRGDNATPYEWAVAVAGQLDSGVLVSYDGNEHGSYGLSRCVTGVVDEYLVNLIVPPGDVDCPAEG